MGRRLYCRGASTAYSVDAVYNAPGLLACRANAAVDGGKRAKNATLYAHLPCIMIHFGDQRASGCTSMYLSSLRSRAGARGEYCRRLTPLAGLGSSSILQLYLQVPYFFLSSFFPFLRCLMRRRGLCRDIGISRLRAWLHSYDMVTLDTNWCSRAQLLPKGCWVFMSVEIETKASQSLDKSEPSGPASKHVGRSSTYCSGAIHIQDSSCG